MVAEHPAPPQGADPYQGMTDGQVLERAQEALRALDRLKNHRANPKSAAWIIQLGIFDTAMAELSRRAMAHVLWKIHEENGKREGR